MADIHDMSGTLLEKSNEGISVAEQIKRLRQVSKYLKREIPAVGSLVTLTRELLYRGPLTKTELPMIVLNVIPEDLEVGDFANVRVGFILLDPENGPFLCWKWVEHWCLEPYVKDAK